MPIKQVRDTVAPYGRHHSMVFRVGLGTLMVLAGIHQFLVPARWASYMAPLFADLFTSIGITPVLFMQVNGLGELVLGALLLADVYTTTAAALTTLGLVSIIVNLVIAGPASYADIILRDIGLFFLGLGVTLQSTTDEVNKQ
ncbi:MAG: DoxX family membrane protein [Candidatus Nanohaloarchaea archaeon]|nr:DoxX family membrane protein [Candidatus Nanohaloarchaea archaeon]